MSFFSDLMEVIKLSIQWSIGIVLGGSLAIIVLLFELAVIKNSAIYINKFFNIFKKRVKKGGES